MLPHEMTKQEYMEFGEEWVKRTPEGIHVSYVRRTGFSPRKPCSPAGHVYHIKQAIEAGEKISPRVLADYP
jgi:hypothetical protein